VIPHGQDIRFEGEEVGASKEVVVLLWADEIAPLQLIN
jgi:hypothetical protein